MTLSISKESCAAWAPGASCCTTHLLAVVLALFSLSVTPRSHQPCNKSTRICLHFSVRARPITFRSDTLETVHISIEMREASCCKRTLVLSRVTSTAQVGDAKRAPSSNITVPLKKRSQTPGSLCVKGNTPLRSAGGIPCGWTDVCGFVKPPNSNSECLVRKHGAFEINREDFGALPKRSNSHATKRGST